MPRLSDCGRKVEIVMTIRAPRGKVIAVTDTGGDGCKQVKDFMERQLKLCNLHRNGPAMTRAGLSSHRMTGQKG